MNVHLVWFLYHFCDVLVCRFFPCNHTAKCTSTQFRIEQTHHLQLWLWLKHLHRLACHMLFLWQETDWSVEMRRDRSMNLQFQNVMKKSLQQKGHLPLVPYYTNQGNKSLYSFYSSPTDNIWTHLPQHPDKPALPWNLNIIIRLELNNIGGNMMMCTVSFKFIAQGSNHNRRYLKWINLENET